MSGKITLVGVGPGSLEHMTQRARDVIAQVDTVVGCSTYIELVADLGAGKEVVNKSMTEQQYRAVHALTSLVSGPPVQDMVFHQGQGACDES